MVHNLKILEKYYHRVVSGEKTFEIRKNDRDFQRGDVLCLLPVADDNSNNYIDDYPALYVEVTYISSFKQKGDYVVMSIKKDEPKES